jgi:capsular polysaccharide biosynthesis protein
MPIQLAFPGLSLVPYAKRIKRLIDRTGACTVLDYGCGKGLRYGLRPLHVGGEGSWRNLLDYWNLAAVYCYDPCFEPFSRLPVAKYDGVICVNALEQSPEEDIPWILQELVDRAGRFLFASIACFPGRLRLPNGEEARCTVRPPEWWRAMLVRAVSSRDGDLLWDLSLAHPAEGTTKAALVETRISSSGTPPADATFDPDPDDLHQLVAQEWLEAGELETAAEAMRNLSPVKSRQLNVAVCRSARLDPSREAGEPYVTALSDVKVDTTYWTVFDHERAYPVESYQRNFANSPLVNQRVSRDRDRFLVSWKPPSATIEQPCVLVGSDDNYAHWVLRSLLKLWLIDPDPELRELPWVVGPALSAVQREYLEALGASESRLLHVASNDVVHFRTLHVPTQMLGNRGFTEGVNWLRKKLAHWIAPPGEARDLIYVARADASRRRLVNEHEVFETLSPLGFRRVVLNGMALRDQLAIFSRARCIVAPHGAALANLIFSPPGTRVVEILSTNIAAMGEVRWLAAHLGQHVESVVSNDYAIDGTRPDDVNPMHWNYRASVAEVCAAAQRALA